MLKGLWGIVFCLFVWSAVTATAQPRSDRAAAPRIEVADLVVDREFVADYRISPDGSKLAWFAAEGDGIVVMVARVDQTERAVIRAHPRSFSWAADSRFLLLQLDPARDENFHIYAANTDAPEMPMKDLTPYANVAATVLGVSRADPSHVLLQHNARNPKYFDLYRVNIATGVETQVAQNPGNVVEWLIDDGRLRGRVSQERSRRHLELLRTGSEEWVRVKSWAASSAVQILGFRDERMWLASNHGRDKIALVEFDAVSGSERVVYGDPEADLDIEESAVVIGPKRKEPVMAISEPDYPRVKIFDERVARALAPFLARGPARVYLSSIDDEERLATVRVFDGLGTRFHLLNLTTGRTELLAEDTFSRMRATLAVTTPIKFTSRDGLDIRGYLTLPRGHQSGSLPMVLRVHGGPWYRNIWGNTDFRQAAAQVQFLANRGYAVLEINYRGSTGYGRSFTRAAIGEFASAMHNDLVDGVEWAISEGIARRERVAIMGASFGGYATLVALTVTPNTFACGIAAAAPSDLARLIESFPPYWEHHIGMWHLYVGNPANTKHRAVMDSKSPLFHVGAVRRPLLLVHGKTDTRVRFDQAEELMDALLKAGKDVEFLPLEKEGHFIVSPRSNEIMYRRIERFLERCLAS